MGVNKLARDWENQFRIWAKPPSETEQEKQANAENMIRDAISEYVPLQSHQIAVFAQGSYRNNRNVRLDSDVDICACCKDTSFFDLSQGWENVLSRLKMLFIFTILTTWKARSLHRCRSG